MGFKGDLSSFHLADVFQTLSMSQKEGTLVIEDGRGKKCIYFGRGTVRLLATGTRASAPLGETLVGWGVLTESQLEAALANAKQGGRRLGEVLQVMGFATQAQIDQVVHSQIEEEVYDLFWWKTAHFEFVDGAPSEDLTDPHSHATSLAFDVNALLFEAARRLDEWEKMKQALPDPAVILVLTEAAQADVDVGAIADPRQLRVLRLCDGSRSLQQVCEQARMGRFEPFRLLYEGVAAGRLRVAMPGDLRAAAVRYRDTGDLVRGLAVARAAMEAEPEDLDLLQLVAEIEGQMGDGKAASQTWLKVAAKQRVVGAGDRGLGALERAVAADAGNLDAGMALCRQQADAGNQEGAERAVRPLATALLAAQRAEEARDLCGWALGFAREPIDLRVVQAQAHFRLGKADVAHGVLRQALVDYPPKERRKAQRLLARVRELAPGQAELAGMVEGMIERNTRAILAVKVTVGTLVLGAALVAAGLWYRGRDQEARAAFEQARQEAAALMAAKKWEEARAALRKVQDQIGFTSAAKQLEEQLAEVARQQKEDDDRRAKEKAEQDRLRRIAAAEKQKLLGEAERLALEGPDLAVPLASFRELEAWAKEAEQPEIAEQAGAGRKKIETTLAEAEKLAAQAAEQTAGDRLEEARKTVRRLWSDYARCAVARKTPLPVKVVTLPAGASVKRGPEDLGRSPVVVPMDAGTEKTRILIAADGFLPMTQDIPLAGEQAVLEFRLEKLVAWRHRTRGAIEARPVVQGGVAYFGSRDGRLYAVRATDGELIWTFEAGDAGAFIGSPAVRGELLYAGSNDQKLYCVALDGGKKRWEYSAGKFVQGSPLVLDDLPLVLVGSHDQKLHAVHRDTGKGVWTVNTGGPVTCRPVQAGSSVLFGSEDGVLRAVDPVNGKVLWQVECGSELIASPVVQGERVYVATKGGEVRCLELATRKLLWKHVAGAAVLRAVVATPDRVWFGTLDGAAVCLNAGDGTLRWTFRAQGPIAGGLVVDEGLLAFGSRDGWLYVLEAETGAERWRLQTRGAVNSTPAVEDGRLFFGSDDGQLCAVDLR